MMEAVKIFKTYGGLGVVSVWLFMTNSRVDKLELELQACNDSKIDIYRELTIPKTSQHNKDKPIKIAILSQSISLKNSEDEEC
jgi:hypothetical protein